MHTLAGIVTLIPVGWCCASHWWEYRHHPFSSVVFLGYAALVCLAVCALSGVVITWQALFGIRTPSAWRALHLHSTFGFIAALGPHLVLAICRSDVSVF